MGLADSKTLSGKQREALLKDILEQCDVGVGVASAAEIDERNILQATFLAMQRAVAALGNRPDKVVVDGNRAPSFDAVPVVETLVKGDALCAQIAAASIVAKVLRDRAMSELDVQYPGYGFSRHAGYGVAAHMTALQQLGPCPEHRRSFAPVARAAALKAAAT